MPTQYTKSPTSDLDWTWDWASKGWLAAGETITTAAITVIPDGLVKKSQGIDGGKVNAWFTGGQFDVEYLVNCHIETSQGRVDDRSIKIRVRNR